MTDDKRWEHQSEFVTCRSCEGSGQDDDELDGQCVSCWGKGEYEVHRSFCNWCGSEDWSCECDERKDSK